ncbi:hypothetical protein ACFFF6_14835, partial [Brachybacterium hainanense]
MFVLCYDLHGRGRSALDRGRARADAPDRVPELLAAIAPLGLRRAPERALGDQAVAIADEAREAVDLLRIGCELGGWAIGLGIGPALARPAAPPLRAEATDGSLGATAPVRAPAAPAREARGPALACALD